MKVNGENMENKKTLMSFENYKIDKISLYDKKSIENTFEIILGVSKALEKEEETVLSIGVLLETGERHIELVMKGMFLFESNIKYENKEKFLKINGAAILYPYIRAYISTLTSFDQAGSSVIIPTINFQKLYEDEKENNNNVKINK